MGNSNSRKDATLGMPHGTAANRLRKNILFHLLKKHEENICTRCGKKIEIVGDLSIEHIKPWEGRSAELFWDLNNIAFSHLRCNIRESNDRSPRIGPVPKKGPEGTAWCIGHQMFESVEKFYKNSHKWNGFRGYCKEIKHH